ncbi:MAG: AraC family transcriptional regulator [Geminicoccaceae bacterium]|nr:MAG: AraC family transcriptional regulator [Geminicoccaceae bacterium]
MEALFNRHRYPLHRHDTYVVAVIEAGCEAMLARGQRWRATSGQIVLSNPDELHDGAPDGPAFGYRVFYPSEAQLCRLGAELVDDPGRCLAAPGFERPVIDDPALAKRLLGLHRTLERASDPLQRETALAARFAPLLQRHGRLRLPHPGEARKEPRRIATVTAWMRDELDRAFSLDELAQAAGLSRFHFLRVFRAATGQTPHAWLINQRVNRARMLLKGGARPAEVAAALGFADQAHLTRLFKRIVGVTPGAYARTFRG